MDDLKQELLAQKAPVHLIQTAVVSTGASTGVKHRSGPHPTGRCTSVVYLEMSWLDAARFRSPRHKRCYRSGIEDSYPKMLGSAWPDQGDCLLKNAMLIMDLPSASLIIDINERR